MKNYENIQPYYRNQKHKNVGLKGHVFLMMLRCEYIEGAQLTPKGLNGLSPATWVKINHYLCKYWKRYEREVDKLLKAIHKDSIMRNN